MENVNFTAFDFETATHDRMPCQLGIVIVQSGKIVKEKLFLFKPPENRYDEGCTRIHGIKPEHTEHLFEFDLVWKFVRHYFHRRLIVAHNIEFDFDVLYRAINHYDLQDYTFLAARCTKDIYCGRSLTDVHQALGIPLDNHHDALCDARACADIFIRYMNGVDPEKLNYPQKRMKRKTSYGTIPDNDRIISKEAKIQDLSMVENKDNPFYNKKIVISGIFGNFPVRDDLALLLKKYGADINGSISKKTDIFLAGDDYGPVKMEKVIRLNAEGHNIELMNESGLMMKLTKAGHMQPNQE